MHNMKKNLIFTISTLALLITMLLGSLVSCNKKLDLAQPIAYTQDTVSYTLGDYISSDANYSFYKLMTVKVGIYSTLTDKTQINTVFAPNNNAIKQLIAFATGGAVPLNSPDAVFAGFIINASAATVTGLLGPIVKYSIIPGISLIRDSITQSFPNIQLPTTLSAGNIPGTILPFAVTAFPSRRGSTIWYNNVPSLGQVASTGNGVLYGLFGPAIPPSQVMAQILYSDSRFTIFHAAINRGDSGQPAASQIDAALANPGANLTLFAPTNTAMKQLIFGLSGGAIPIAAPDAVFIGFINNFVSPRVAQGLVAYHFMGTRAFSVNFPATEAFFPTLLNRAIPIHPGVKVQSFFTGPVVDSIKVTGVGNGGVAATSKPASNFDKNAVNGIIHIIDRVLLPQ